MARKVTVLAFWFLVIASVAGLRISAQQQPRTADVVARAKAALAQTTGTIMVRGLKEPVEVLRDKWGVPHIYARNTEDLFFAQGYVVAQDRMWQLEMWRRNGEGKLAEVLGPEYVTRDRFARTLAFRGNWDEEFKKYHPEGRKIFDAFARGINMSIQKALDENKVPVEFEILGFRPQPLWTAKTVLTRMPEWSMGRNAASEVTRALDIKAMGVQKVEELKPTTPPKKIEIPVGLDLNDIEPGILDIMRGANDFRWNLKGNAGSSATLGLGQSPVLSGNGIDEVGPSPDMGSNNWVIGPSKSVTGGPLVANDPHREIVNPALRYLVHLNAPGWNAIGATEPGLPGITIGHNDRLAWGFTILVMDQEDLYVEETQPENPNKYLYKGQWLDMQVERELIWVKGQATPKEIEVKLTRHGPVLYENTQRHRAIAMRWIGSETGGVGYLGSLNVMQTRNWKEFNDELPKAWFIPAHSLVYGDVDGNYGYIGAGWTPVRKNWDGLLPVPGKDGQYEWDGHVPFDKLPRSLNSPRGFYNSANNDVAPKIVPGYNIPLGYEYTAPFRYDRQVEVLSANRKFSVADMEQLQHDVVSLPARELVPLLRNVKTANADVQKAVDQLLGWNYTLDRDSIPATIYEFWVNKVMALAYQPRIPESARGAFRQYQITETIGWMKAPDQTYGRDARARTAERDRILVTALEQALADIRRRVGDDTAKWKWGNVHTADFVHPLASNDATIRDLFQIDPVPRGGDGNTVQASSNLTDTSTKQTTGASFMFVMDVKDWDRSTALSTPGNSAQPLSPHYQDLAPLWGEGKYFPLAFSRKKVEEVTESRLVLQPVRDFTLTGTSSQSAVQASRSLYPSSWSFSRNRLGKS